MSPKVALAAACGFLAGVLAVLAFGGVPDPDTEVATVTRTVAGPVTNGGTVIVSTAVPDVTGQPLDVAKERLTRAKFEADVQGGGTFGVLVEENWRVSSQAPGPGTQLEQGSSVRLVIERR